MIDQNVYAVGTASTTVVAPTNDHVTYVLKNLEPSSVDDYARDGHIYLIGQRFAITSGASVSFSIETGATGAQFDFYDIISDTSTIYAELIEDATITTTGSALTAYNLNRNYTDTHTSVLKAASAVTGGTTISSEYVTASIHAGGSMSSAKIHTLKPNTQYAMKFANTGNQTTNVFFQLGFSEKYNGYNSIWLGTPNASFVLKAGQELSYTLTPGAPINATALVDGSKLAVIRQR